MNNKLHHNAKDLTGQRFGRLIAIEPTEKRSNGKIVYYCLCDCGKKCFVGSADLRKRHTRSCGCLKKDNMIEKNTKHGMYGTPAYISWTKMHQRCYNPKNHAFKDYSGRGITVSEKFNDFQTWYEHIGPCPGPGYSQDRIDNDGNYERGNIQWATQQEQRINSRPISSGPRKQRWFLAYNEKTGKWFESNNQSEFARQHNMHPSNISMCLNDKQKACRSWTFQWLPN